MTTPAASPATTPLVPSTAPLGDDLRGLLRLLLQAITATSGLAEHVHANVLGVPSRLLGAPTRARTRGIAGLAYASVRTTSQWLGGGLDAALAKLPLAAQTGTRSARREALLAALNGVLGDHLQASSNSLALSACLRSNGQALPLDDAAWPACLPFATPKLLVQVHGLCMNDLQWRQQGHDHGAQLAAEHGYTPVHLHYNSGLSIASNGQAFAQLLQQLLARWPVPVERFAILGHSMGGLVARAAILHASRNAQAWLQQLDQVVFLGTPHHGAPLERAGHLLQHTLGLTPWTAPFTGIGRLRSIGIQDLRHGSIGAPNADYPPLPAGLRAYAVAASTQAIAAGRGGRYPRGDGLVPIASALGEHRDPRRNLRIPKAHQYLVAGTGHIGLLSSIEVYQQLRRWLA
ncbi:MAG: hypothetical protein U1F19_00715 [Lysobacterales bacterium]